MSVLLTFLYMKFYVHDLDVFVYKLVCDVGGCVCVNYLRSLSMFVEY